MSFGDPLTALDRVPAGASLSRRELPATLTATESGNAPSGVEHVVVEPLARKHPWAAPTGVRRCGPSDLNGAMGVSNVVARFTRNLRNGVDLGEDRHLKIGERVKVWRGGHGVTSFR